VPHDQRAGGGRRAGGGAVRRARQPQAVQAGLAGGDGGGGQPGGAGGSRLDRQPGAGGLANLREEAEEIGCARREANGSERADGCRWRMVADQETMLLTPAMGTARAAVRLL